MTEADVIAPATREPLTQRLAETPPGSPLRFALATAVALLALFLGAEAIFDRFAIVFGDDTDPWSVETQVNFRLVIVMILLVAYLPAAYAIGVRGARRTVEELRPFLRADGDATRIAAGAGRFPVARLRAAGWIGVACAFAIPIWTDRSIDAWFVWAFSTEPLFQRALLMMIGWFAGRFLYSIGAESRRLSQLGREHVVVDLLDLRCLAPLTRQGLRYALLVVGLISILALNLFDSDKQGLLFVMVIANFVALAAAAAALLLPLRGARQAIITAKRAELDWCDAELRRARAALDGDAAPGGARPLADLVAWRGLVAAVSEWPLDAPALGRFALYLAIPIGSWLGGALVERIVDAVLR